MFDDFFIRALVAGIGVALIAGPLGCLIIWRRMAFFGDTLAHASLFGIVIALLFELNFTIIVFLVCGGVSIALFLLQRRSKLPADSLLGLLAHSSLAVGLVCLSILPQFTFDLSSILFGDILSVSEFDIFTIYGVGLIVLFVLILYWRKLFAATFNHELAAAEGMEPDKTSIVFFILMAIVIAISIKIVGVLLITALLIIPAAAARRATFEPEQMAILASVFGVLSVLGGLFGSLEWDTPSGPSIIVVALLFFLISLTPLANIILLILAKVTRYK